MVDVATELAVCSENTEKYSNIKNCVSVDKVFYQCGIAKISTTVDINNIKLAGLDFLPM